MTINKALITVEEANAYLSQQADWIASTTEQKEYHIGRGSTYVQLTYTCVDVDWDGTETIPDNVKEATAWFSYASFSGTLFPDPANIAANGNLTEQSSQLGGLKSTKKWDYGGVPSVDPLGYPDDLMKYSCTRASGGGAVTAIRT